jgi:NTE family protein
MSRLKIIRLFFMLALIAILTACAGSPPNINIPSVPPLTTPPRHTPVRVALALGAGGAKGYAHLGALQVLEAAGVPIDLVSGASAGSIVGALYSDRGSVAHATKALMNATFWDLADTGNFISLSGVVEGYHLEKFLLKHMKSHSFKQTKIKFIAVATNLKNGNRVILDSGPIPPAVLASGAAPGAVRPVILYGNTLIDGGMVDPIPVDVLKPYHPKLIIAINISQQIDHNIPSTAYGIYEKGYAYSWLRLNQLSEKEADVLIRPAVGSVGTFDMSAKNKMYQAGVTAAQKALPAILKLMKQRHIARVIYHDK